MKIALEDANKTLRPIMRGIDKRTTYSTVLTEGDKPGVELTISRREKSKKITIPVEALVGVEEDAMRRHELRNRIKRAHDRMLYVKLPIANTKMIRGSASADGFFRSSGGGRR